MAIWEGCADLMLGNFLLGAVRLHKNANLDKDGLDDTKLNAEK